MNAPLDHNTLHRGAKYFMDTGRARTHAEAVGMLETYGLSIQINPTTAATTNGQIALLTLVNIGRRTFLGGVEVSGVPDVPCRVRLASATRLRDAVTELGGTCIDRPRSDWPLAAIGDIEQPTTSAPVWRLHWSGWRGGVLPAHLGAAYTDDVALPLAACLAASACAAEVFAFHAADHMMAGKRAAGLSLWSPGVDWLDADPKEPSLSYLPSRLWLIGLGNLGQAYAWLLACLPYRQPSEVQLTLQDFDRLEVSNDSTSVLSSLVAVGNKKARHVSGWLESRGFSTAIVEQRFTRDTRPQGDDPRVALCGVDNPLARSVLEEAGFDLVVESGLGAGPGGFRNFSLHSFPSSLCAKDLWRPRAGTDVADVSNMPAYEELRKSGADRCGLAQLASRTIGVPFVGLTAGLLVISELLRRLHGGPSLELVSGSLLSLTDLEAISMKSVPYRYGHVTV